MKTTIIQIEIFEDDKYSAKTAKQLCNDWLQDHYLTIKVIDVKYQKIENTRSILVIYQRTNASNVAIVLLTLHAYHLES